MIDIPCKNCGSNLWTLRKYESGALNIKCSVCGFEIWINRISRIEALIDLLEGDGEKISESNKSN